jgi:hypothetical protein
MKLTVEMVRTAVLSLTGALVIGIASFGLSSLSAHAEPKDANGLACFTSDAQGISGIYFAGEASMVSIEDGIETALRCDGRTGQWEQVSMIMVGVGSQTD